MARFYVAASSQYSIGTPLVGQNTPYTFACWFSATSYPASASYICAYQVSSSQAFRIGESGGNMYAQQYDGSSAGTSLIARPAAGAYHHLAGVFTSSASRTVYLDGVAGATNTTAVIENWTPGSMFLATDGVGGFLNGALAECAIWNVALDAGEVLGLAKGVCPMNIRPQSLINYWPLFANDGTTEIDRWRTGVSAGLTATNGPSKTDHPRVYYAFGPLNRSVNSTTPKALSATATAVATLGTIRVFLRALTATAVTASATLSKSITKTMLATVSKVATVSQSYFYGLPRLAKATTRFLNGIRSSKRVH